MKDLKNKVAFITGGASGLGLAMASALGRRGVRVMIADIEKDALGNAIESLRAQQIHAEGVVCNVGDRESVRAAAAKTLETFGKVHVVCNNAGIGVTGPVGTIAERDWDWIFDVNLKGVIHGTEIFLPLIERHGEGGHFVNTASMSGLVVRPEREPYCATKYAIVALSEGWSLQLKSRNIGVSILCPGYVRTRIGESARARPERYGGPKAPGELFNHIGLPTSEWMPAEPVGERVVEAIENNELYVITHPEMKDLVAARFEQILAAFDRAAASPALSKLPTRVMPDSDRQLADKIRRR